MVGGELVIELLSSRWIFFVAVREGVEFLVG